MGTMTVWMTVMRSTAPLKFLERVPPISSPVPTTDASRTPGAVTRIMTVGTVQMRQTAVSLSQLSFFKSKFYERKIILAPLS